MPRSSHETKPTLGLVFWLQWILGNSLGYGVGLGLPILWADLLSAERYEFYGIVALALCGFWIGLAQWLVLRTAIAISARWIWAVLFSPFICTFLVVFFGLTSPKLMLLVVVIYPLLNSLSQWRILRQIIQPSWQWIFTSFIAGVLGEAIGGMIGIVSNMSLEQPGFCTLIGGLCGGFIYSLITILGLRRLMRQEILPLTKKASGLDVPPNGKLWKFQIISILSLILLFLIWSFVVPPVSILSRNTSNSLPLWFILVYPFVVIFVYINFSTLVHELGHLLFALFHRFDLKLFAVSRWVLIRRDQGLRLRRTRRLFAGGFVQPVTKSLNGLNRRLIMMLLGGPAASFLLFCVGVIPLFFQKFVSENEVVRLITFLSFFSLHSTILNLIPFRISYMSTDGRRVLDLLQNNSQGKRFAGLYSVNSGLRNGIRPRDIDYVLINQVLAIPEKSMDHISGLLIAYYAELDKEQFELAGDFLDQALAMNLYCPAIFRGSLLLEGVYFEAHIRHRVDLARQWFEQIQDTALIEPYSLLRAEAALHLAEGNKEAAQIKAEQGLASVQRNRFMLGSAIAESEWLQALLQKMV